MAFVLPNFNLNVAFWRNANWPANPPDVITIGNLSPGKIVSTGYAEIEGPGADVGVDYGMYLRLPKGTDVQDVRNNGTPDVCECPYTSGRFYTVQFVDDIGGGFANEHRFCLMNALSGWPTPYPPVGGFTPIIPPGPPTALSDIVSAIGGDTGQSNIYPSLGGSIMGCICMINDPTQPSVTVNGGPNRTIAGLIYEAIYPGFGFPAMYLWPFAAPGLVGPNTIAVTPGGIGPQSYIGMAISGCGSGTGITMEGNPNGAVGPPLIPPYTPAPAHPRGHLVFAVCQTPLLAPGWIAPFSNFYMPAPSPLTVVTVQLSVGVYMAGIGGQFPAGATGSSGPWVEIQYSYAP